MSVHGIPLAWQVLAETLQFPECATIRLWARLPGHLRWALSKASNPSKGNFERRCHAAFLNADLTLQWLIAELEALVKEGIADWPDVNGPIEKILADMNAEGIWR